MLNQKEIKHAAEMIAATRIEIANAGEYEDVVDEAIRNAFVDDGKETLEAAMDYAMAWLDEYEACHD